ncbi:MAG: redoxin domain-containing protein [Chloroflexi bacterium]|nr:redoxin domain-containing protein [Chloroflexota bacterium]
MPASRYVCPSCGNRIDPSLGKCPYCGQLGNRFTMIPTQGHGVMKPGQGDLPHTFAAPPPTEQGPTAQKVCFKCGRVIPPGSSQCPVHGKFGGGNTMRNIAPAVKDKTFEGEVYRRMEESRSGPAVPARSSVRQTAPEEIYPQMASAPAMPDTGAAAAGQRSCPSCGYAVPDRSKVCPTCGNNRLPPEARKPFVKAEDRYKATEAAHQQAYAAYPPQANQYYGQPAAQPSRDQYYGQPAAQPYEMAYPAPAPGFAQEVYPERKRGKDKKPREREERMAKPGQRSSPLPILLALIAIVGVIAIGIIFLMDQLRTPAPAVMPPTTPPATSAAKAPVISEIQFKDITRDSATVTWKTDKKSNSIVMYCIDEEGGQCQWAPTDENLVTEHSVKLSNLKAGKSYHITVKSKLDNSDDINTPEDTKEANEILSLLGVPDVTPPKISAINVTNITGSSATIKWNTDEPSASQVAYGTSPTYGTLQPEQTDTLLTINHEVMLQGLPPNSHFNYKVISRDAAGNESSSPNATFDTSVSTGTAIGNLAPDFTLKNAADGNDLSLSSLRGKKVMVNFWHTGCGYCKAEMPHFQTIQQNNPEIAVLAIDTDATNFGPDNPVHVGDYINQNGFTFTVLLDPGDVGRTYGATGGIPITYFLDAQGMIRKFKDGSFSSANDIQSMLNY